MLKGYGVNYLYTNSIKMVISSYRIHAYIYVNYDFVLFCIGMGYIIVLDMCSLVVDSCRDSLVYVFKLSN